jgi:hypothetical protein
MSLVDVAREHLVHTSEPEEHGVETIRPEQ